MRIIFETILLISLFCGGPAYLLFLTLSGEQAIAFLVFLLIMLPGMWLAASKGHVPLGHGG